MVISVDRSASCGSCDVVGELRRRWRPGQVGVANPRVQVVACGKGAGVGLWATRAMLVPCRTMLSSNDVFNVLPSRLRAS